MRAYASDGLNNGGTAEDRFYGVIAAGGISAIKMSIATSGGSQGSLEVDHLQYGAVPEPGLVPGLLAGGLALAFVADKRFKARIRHRRY